MKVYEVTAPKRVFSTLKGAVFTVALFGVSLAITPFCLFVPFPAIKAAFTYGGTININIFLIASILITWLMGPLTTAIFFTTFALAILMLPRLLLKMEASKAVVITVATNFAVFLALVFSYQAFTGVQISDLIVKYLSDLLPKVTSYYENQAILKKEEINLLKEQFSIITQFLSYTYYSFFAVLITFVSAFSVLLVKLLKKSLPLAPQIDDFSNFRSPEILVLPFLIAAYTLVFLNHYLANQIASNIIIILFVCYLFQGLALFYKFIEKNKYSFYIKCLLYFLMVTSPQLTVVLVILGISDVWFDFRKPKQIENL